MTISDAHGDDINAVCYGDTESHLLYSGGDDGLVKVILSIFYESLVKDYLLPFGKVKLI